MKEIKRILNLLLVILVMLSTFAITRTFAIADGEQAETSICTDAGSKIPGVTPTDTDSLDGVSLHYSDLANKYPIFCRQKGTYVANNKTALTNISNKTGIDYKAIYDYNNGNVSV